jgi:hypothetical protein
MYRIMVPTLIKFLYFVSDVLGGLCSVNINLMPEFLIVFSCFIMGCFRVGFRVGKHSPVCHRNHTHCTDVAVQSFFLFSGCCHPVKHVASS